MKEISRRTTSLFKNIDELEQLALFGLRTGKDCEPEGEMMMKSKKEGIREEALSRSGTVLRNLTEYNVRNLCGPAIYGAGLQAYLQGRMTRGTFWKNSLWGKIGESGVKDISDDNQKFFLPSITLERSSTKPRISGACGCLLSREGNLCPHVAALMIAWVRRPFDFAEQQDYQTRRSEFDESKQRTEESLRDLTNAIEKGSSTLEDLATLRRTRSKFKVWLRMVKGSGGGENFGDRKFEGPDMELTHEFLRVLNSVSFDLIYTIDRKYGDEFLDIYGSDIESAFGRTLELLTENASRSKLKSSLESGKERGRRRRKQLLEKRPATGAISSGPGRSWDSLVESFSSS